MNDKELIEKLITENEWLKLDVERLSAENEQMAKTAVANMNEINRLRNTIEILEESLDGFRQDIQELHSSIAALPDAKIANQLIGKVNAVEYRFGLKNSL